MNFFDQNSAPAISGNLANYTFRVSRVDPQIALRDLQIARIHRLRLTQGHVKVISGCFPIWPRGDSFISLPECSTWHKFPNPGGAISTKNVIFPIQGAQF